MLPILHQSYWRDEAFSVLLSLRDLKEIFFLTAKDFSPPLYYVFLHFWMRFFGDAEYISRTLSLGFHLTLSVISFFLLVQLTKNRLASFLGSLAVLLNPFLLEYAFETRGYSLFALFVVGCAFWYLKQKPFLASLFLFGAILTHNFGVFFALALAVYWLARNGDRLSEKINEAFLLFGLPLLGFSGWFVFLARQWIKIAEGFWISPKTSSVFIDAFRIYFRGSGERPSQAMLYNLALVLVFLGLYYWFDRLTDKKIDADDQRSLSLVSLFSLPFLAIFFISAIWVPIFHERYLIPVLPLFILWIAYSLFRLTRLKKVLAGVVGAVSVGYALFAVQGAGEILNSSTKPPINYAVRQIMAKAGPADMIVSESALNFLETKYYVNHYGGRQQVLALVPEGKVPFYIGGILFEEADLIKKLPEYQGVWIVSPDGGHSLKEEMNFSATPTPSAD